ncbi:origin recognition complex subunit 2 [Lentinus tigrinus ALCF2SS1-7]|uniref:Origin recognition complex subunit 2 n=1 Tax=Lentinus tigrinus ALCF2SS1-6 TaxID=1328759 RepID=A0A5C2S613_9APHY|nr:origin recognition complex subunit 2 [Lentinus tigrinus ALCF2SS1-6]RPD73579.1 origin recognition complex subunit 2 [Lentinus tigrinus ALCF2SS1-7]
MRSESEHTSYADEDEELEDWPASEPATPSRRHLSDYDDYDDDEDPFLAPDEPSQGFATHTSFDAYFLQASKPSRTSSNVFSALVPPLTPEEYSAVLTKLQTDPRERERVLWRDPKTRRACFRRFKTELREGFNLLMYGYGSKREFLNAFAKDLARTGAHVVVANGFQPSFAFKDLLAGIERVPGVLDGPSSSSSASHGAGGMDAQVQRIHAFFSTEDAPELYIVIHTIEGNAFRVPKNRAALALLALAPRIHVVASTDHIASAQRWSLSELFARKPEPSSASASTSASSDAQAPSGVVPSRGFAWLWHDLTTLAPYDFELAYADPTSLAGAAALRGARTPAAAAAAVAAATGGAATPGALVTETAARHVLASVTSKAKKLFVLLGSKQLEVMDASASSSSDAQRDKDKDKDKDKDRGKDRDKDRGGAEEHAYDYDRLFAAARENFVATNDTALRALLGEFRDHGMVVATSAQGAEAMWIPMRRDALLKIAGELKAQGHDL